MTKSGDFLRYIIILIIIYCILFVFEMPWIELSSSIVGVILFGYATIRFRAWLIDRRRPIVERLNYFLNQTILTLRANNTPYERFNFPEQLNDWYEISTDNQTLNSFSRLKPLLGWKIKRYNRFCNQIDTMLRELIENTRERGIIKRIQTGAGREYVIEDRYETFSETQRNDLLISRDLIDDIASIEQLRRQLPSKSRKLLNKFQRLRIRWNR